MTASWLDPAAEVPMPTPFTRDDAAFVRLCYDATAGLGLTPWQRYELCGIACLETGWGKSRAVPLGNLGGSKTKVEIAAWYRRETGKPMRWFRDAGHLASGDPAVVRYCVFDDAPQYWRMWLWRHVGSAAGVAPFKDRYAEAGRLFWAGDPTAIRALIVAEYRGRVTAGDPKKLAAAVAGHQQIVRRAMRLAT